VIVSVTVNWERRRSPVLLCSETHEHTLYVGGAIKEQYNNSENWVA
jgi:hypothetical protein